jgi:hypothetical protein
VNEVEAMFKVCGSKIKMTSPRVYVEITQSAINKIKSGANQVIDVVTNGHLEKPHLD